MSPTPSATSIAFHQKLYHSLNSWIDYAIHFLRKSGC